MEPQINEPESVIAPLKKVTPLSKYLAMALFVALPFIGGYIGYVYAPEKVIVKEVVVELPVLTEESKPINYLALYQAQFDTQNEVEPLYKNAEGLVYFKTLTFSSKPSSILIYQPSVGRFKATEFYISRATGDQVSPDGRRVSAAVDYYSATTSIQITDFETGSIFKFADVGADETFQSGVCGYAGPTFDITWVSTSTLKYGVYKYPPTDPDACEFDLIEYREEVF